MDEAVARYLACGLWQSGFARVRCRRCPEEFLVAFSCKRRAVCPSCGAKRAAELAAFLSDEVVEQVGHAQWVFAAFVARVLVQIPDPRRHLVRHYGAYSNATRGKREKAAASADPSSPHEAPEDAAIGRSLHPWARRQLAFPAAGEPVPEPQPGRPHLAASRVASAPERRGGKIELALKAGPKALYPNMFIVEHVRFLA